MTRQFNLANEPWITALNGTGTGVHLSLRDTFLRAHELSSVWLPTAVQTGGTVRLLEAITYRITGTDRPAKNDAIWHKERNALFDQAGFDQVAVHTYFDEWEHRFWLIDPDRPFGQDPRLAVELEDTHGLSKVVYDMPPANSPRWFGDATEGVSPATAASWLLAALCFGPGGRTGSRAKNAGSVAPPGRNRSNIHLQSRTLHETLLANLLPASDQPEPFPWEASLPAIDVKAPLTAQTHVANRALGRWPNTFLLVAEDGRVVDSYKSWMHRNVVEFDDPHVTYRVRAETKTRFVREPVSANPARALWRDLASLTHNPELDVHVDGLSGVEVVKASLNLPDSIRDQLSIAAHSNALDGWNEAGSWTSVTPPIGSWVASPETIIDAQNAIRALQNQWSSIRSALRTIQTASEGIEGTVEGILQVAEPEFWTAAEPMFWAAIGSLDESDTVAVARRTALDLFDRHTDQFLRSPRLLPAVGRARRKVATANRKIEAA